MGDTVLLQTSAHAQVAGLVDSVKEVLYYGHAITSSAVIFPVYMLWAMQHNVSLRKGVGFSFIGIKKLNCMPASFLSYHIYTV